MIDSSDLEDAFLFVGSDQPFMNSAIVNKRTGETFYQSELSGIDDFPENFEGDNFIEIPHKNDLDLGRDLVFDFVSSHLPQRLGEVDQIFRARGAYHRFKSLLESVGLLEKWYSFEDEQIKSALRQWCKDNGLRIKE